jgi:hypothetical protein
MCIAAKLFEPPDIETQEIHTLVHSKAGTICALAGILFADYPQCSESSYIPHADVPKRDSYFGA